MTARRSSFRCAAALAVALLGASPFARADAPPPDAKTSLAAADKAAKAKDWEGALAGYTAAASAQPSALALDGIANAHYELKHVGEAYAAYDEFLKTYPNALGATRKKLAETRLKELAAVTGVLSIRVNETGAAVSIDGKPVGTTPVAALIRVAAGPHKVSVAKDGFAAIDKIADVRANGKEILEIALEREAKTGHLVVKEKSGAPVRVIVDGTDIGAAPLETDLPPGPHEVVVRSANLAAPSKTIEIAKGKTTEVEMVATASSGHLEVQTSDRQGIIFIDGKPVAEGAYAGDLPAGPHALAVTREGFERFEKSVVLADKQSIVETVTLERPKAQGAIAPPSSERTYDGLYGGISALGTIEPSGNGNELETHCSQLGAASCTTPAPIGGGLFGWIGWAWHPVGVELFIAGSYDQTTPKAIFDGSVKPGQNPASASVPRVEQFLFARGGGIAAIRARAMVQMEKLRGSLAVGAGFAGRVVAIERRSKTTDGLDHEYHDSQSYFSPALVLDASVAYRFSPGLALSLGALGLFENAGEDAVSKTENDQYIGKKGGPAYPIPTPGYHFAADVQFFIGPYLGLEFGP